MDLTAWILGTAAVLAALGIIAKSLRSFARWLVRRFFPWLKRAIRLVDDLTGLPVVVARIEADQAAHILLADAKVRDLAALAAGLAEVRAMVKNNGGSSLLDSAHRIEAALGLPEPQYMPVCEPVPNTGPIVLAAVAAGVTTTTTTTTTTEEPAA